MVRLRHILLLCAALLALAAVPTLALADGDEVIRDCYEDGKLDREYTDEELEDAERDLPSDVDEYSDCRSVIAAARARGNKGRKGGTGGVPGAGFRGGGTANADPALSTAAGAQAGSQSDLDALNEIATRNRTSNEEPKVPVSGQPITPTAGAAAVGESANDMPAPLLAALIAVGALGALGGAFAAWRRRPQLLRRGPLRFGRS
jgi:hypothetical protein